LRVIPIKFTVEIKREQENKYDFNDMIKLIKKIKCGVFSQLIIESSVNSILINLFDKSVTSVYWILIIKNPSPSQNKKNFFLMLY
jgi:hypothetical protein